MKTNAKISFALLVFILFLWSFAKIPSIYAETVVRSDESPQPHEGAAYQRYQWDESNNEIAWAEDLHLIAWQAEQNVYINDWKVTIKGDDYWFNEHYCYNIDGEPNGEHEVVVNAWNCQVRLGLSLEITVEFWLNPKKNTIRVKDNYYTDDESPGVEYKAMPDHGWVVLDESSQKIVWIYNDEPAGGDTFQIANFDYHVSIVYYYDLKEVPFDSIITTKFQLIPGDSISYTVPTLIDSGHLYFHYTMLNPADSVISELYGDHGMGSAGLPPMPTLTKWGLIALLIIIASIATWVVLKRRRVVTA